MLPGPIDLANFYANASKLAVSLVASAESSAASSCFNCIKSKRDCDYNARYVFKDYPTLGEAILPEFATELDSAGFAPGSTALPQQPFPQGVHTGFSSLLTPPTPSLMGQVSLIQPHHSLPGGPSSQTEPFGTYASNPTITTTTTTTGVQSWPSSVQYAGQAFSTAQRPPQYAAPPHPRAGSGIALGPPMNTTWPSHSETQTPQQWSSSVSSEAFPSVYNNQLVTPLPALPRGTSFERPLPTPNISATYPESQFTGTSAGATTTKAAPSTGQGSWYLRPDHTDMLDLAAVEIEDDDYYDVLPEEEAYVSPSRSRSSGSYTHPSTSVLTTRSMPGYHTNLAFYNESQAASPLKNQATQSVFRHFIWHTAPALSICERPAAWAHAIKPPIGMSGSPMSCWMDVLPSLAMQDPGLLHAMLAQSSYEIAKTNNASTTSSVKHHVWSLKRVHRALDSPKTRHSVTTLAATLLLGFYEILTADHMRWSTHLSGARHLIGEANFRGMTREIRRRRQMRSDYRSEASFGASLAEPLADIPDTDEPLVETLMGFKVGHSPDSASRDRYTHADLNNYATFQDLFWWYAKQDVYHSIISGNDLLLPYHQWADCPPRAPIGDPEAVFGSNDHVILLMGRIATFSANDRPRKIRAAKAKTPPPPGASVNVPPTPGTPSPPFYGMAPSRGQPQGHSAYGNAVIGTVSNDRHMHSTTAQVEALTSEALAEWNDIRHACEVFMQRLGPEFQPLSEDAHPSFQTPFGRSCHFRSFEIAALWLMYYTALLVLIRAHPFKPAAAVIATGVSARETAIYANEIGRIASSFTSPGMQARTYFRYRGAITGSVVPLFFAGVQYQDSDQRRWTVGHLLDVAKQTGWSTAETCANGCETSWVRAYEMGRGAPWQRIAQDFFSVDQRSSGRYVQLPGGHPVDASDRRLLHHQADSRLLWGFGLLGTVEDLGHMNINE
ncbi:MAG: hypothetical protein Q9159_002512 [Coniocarpon cinnabarinum]